MCEIRSGITPDLFADYDMIRRRLFARFGAPWIMLAVLLMPVMLMWQGAWAMLPFLLTTLLLMVYYYDPDRELPSHPLGIMSPVDGTIIRMDFFHDPFLHRAARRIRIRSGLIRVYHGRSPTEGKLMEYWPQADRENRQYAERTIRAAWWIQTDEQDDVTMIVLGKLAWVRPQCHIRPGERIGQGARCGQFPAGSEIDILIDEKSYLNVQQGQTVKAGVDTLASFNHDNIEAT